MCVLLLHLPFSPPPSVLATKSMRYNVHIAYGYWCHLIKHTLIFIFISLLFSVILFQLPQSFHLVSSHKHISECANINNNMSLNRFSMVNKLCMLNLRVDATSKTGWYLSVLFYYYLARHLPRNIIYIIHRTHTHTNIHNVLFTHISMRTASTLAIDCTHRSVAVTWNG